MSAAGCRSPGAGTRLGSPPWAAGAISHPAPPPLGAGAYFPASATRLVRLSLPESAQPRRLARLPPRGPEIERGRRRGSPSCAAPFSSEGRPGRRSPTRGQEGTGHARTPSGSRFSTLVGLWKGSPTSILDARSGSPPAWRRAKSLQLGDVTLSLVTPRTRPQGPRAGRDGSGEGMACGTPGRSLPAATAPASCGKRRRCGASSRERGPAAASRTRSPAPPLAPCHLHARWPTPAFRAAAAGFAALSPRPHLRFRWRLRPRYRPPPCGRLVSGAAPGPPGESLAEDGERAVNGHRRPRRRRRTVTIIGLFTCNKCAIGYAPAHPFHPSETMPARSAAPSPAGSSPGLLRRAWRAVAAVAGVVRAELRGERVSAPGVPARRRSPALRLLWVGWLPAVPALPFTGLSMWRHPCRLRLVYPGTRHPGWPGGARISLTPDALCRLRQHEPGRLVRRGEAAHGRGMAGALHPLAPAPARRPRPRRPPAPARGPAPALAAAGAAAGRHRHPDRSGAAHPRQPARLAAGAGLAAPRLSRAVPPSRRAAAFLKPTSDTAPHPHRASDGSRRPLARMEVLAREPRRRRRPSPARVDSRHDRGLALGPRCRRAGR